MADDRPIAVLGAGGHAKVVLAALECAGEPIAGLFDDDPDAAGRTLLGVSVHGPIAAAVEAGLERGVLAIGSNEIRERLVERLDLDWAPVVDPAATVHPSVEIGPGAVVLAGAVVQPDAAVGAHAIVNTGATVDHDCRLGPFCHVAPGAHLAGDVRVGRGALVGIGGAVLPGRSIGDWATVGAGGIVAEDIAAGVTAVGVPARPRPEPAA